jgi:hypothetical protein
MTVESKDNIIKKLTTAAGKMQAVQAAARIASVSAESEPEPLSPGIGSPLIPGASISGESKR